jgi:hypothetical protein
MSWRIEPLQADSKPCPCGKGQATVEVIYEDSDWGDKYLGWEGNIVCDHCRPLYSFIPYFRGAALAPKEEVDHRLAQQKQAIDAEKAFVESPEAQGTLDAIAKALDALPTAIAKYNLVVQLKLETRTLATFRKHIRDRSMRRWLDPNFQTYADSESSLQKLRPLYLYLGADVTRLDACISETQALREQARELPTIIMRFGAVSMLAALARTSASAS